MVTVKPGVWCDPCIASLVACLNYGGVETVASCCGHGEQDGRITLTDGRELVIRDAARDCSKTVVSGRDADAPNGRTYRQENQ